MDCLEDLTGLDRAKTIQAHGHIREGTCLICNQKYSLDYMAEFVIKNEIPSCFKCSNAIKPDIVLLGEALPPSFTEIYSYDFPICDLLVIIGTSLAVQP